jgi:DNA invertase Pin-like site-specific DNA recombinase
MIYIYVRVSKNSQSTKSQLPDLEQWAKNQQVKWFKDQFTGKSMDRPGWNRLYSMLQSGDTICCWRLDRLGRTAKGLTALFDDLINRKINLISLKDGLDLTTPAGRLLANMLASVAQFETEIRAERIIAGQAAARAAGKTWGGGKPGRLIKLNPDKIKTIKQMRADGNTITAISRAVSVSRPTIYRILD